MNSHEVFIHIQQGCFAGTGAIVRLPQCQWSKPDGYGKISQCITTTKHSKAKTVCIFLGIYCMVLGYFIKKSNLPNSRWLNGLRFGNVIFLFNFWYGNCCISIQLTLKFAAKSLINKNNHHWMRWWLSTNQATNLHLNHWLPSLQSMYASFRPDEWSTNIALMFPVVDNEKGGEPFSLAN